MILLDNGNFKSSQPYYIYLQNRVDTIIFLDIPLPLNFLQLLKRTFFRVWTKEPLHGTNNIETWKRGFFSSSSLLWRFITNIPKILNAKRMYCDIMKCGEYNKRQYNVVHLRSRQEVNAFLKCMSNNTTVSDSN